MTNASASGERRASRGRALPLFSVASAALAIALLAQSAQAQQQATPPAEVTPPANTTPPATNGEDIVVTAQKREESLQKVPISIAVLGGRALDRQASGGSLAALTLVPAVAQSTSDAGGMTQISIRGVAPASPFGGGSSTTGYYIDAIPFALIRTAAVPSTNVYDLSRIEVLRGPQGTLYGASALNGVVRILTNDADPTKWEFKARGGVSTTKGGDASFRTDAAVNVPLIADKLAIRIVAGVERLGGWIDQPVRGKRNANSSDSDDLRVKLNARPTNELTIDLEAWLSRSRYDAANYADDAGNQSTPLPQPGSTKYGAYNAKVTYDLPFMSISSATSELYFRQKIFTDFSYAAPIDPHLLQLYSDLPARVFSEELLLNSSGNGPWRLSAGAFYRKANDDRFQTLPAVLAGKSISWSDRSKSYAVFGQITRTLADDRFEDQGPIQRSFTFTEGQHDPERPAMSKPPLVASHSFEPVLKRILDCLFFRQLTDRVEEIPSNYQQTFQWIFHDPSVNDKPWSNFMEWLQHGSGCYWINGKAGSGKSTLMKYISGDVRTRRAITIWAGSHSSVIGSFFLWNLGSPLQKSQSGLLRSLLLDVLDRHPSLISSAFPSLCRYALSHSANRLGEPSFPELKKAFLNLVQQQNNSLRMCFFIDGIDEYEGDQAELIDLLKEVVTSSNNVKMVLSSRPTAACIEELSEYPSLRLQDLTHDDILLFVTDSLGQHRNMKSLEIEDPLACTELISEISSKASGVFLWVMLVVRSLLRGLRNHDRVPDLRRRLDELPKGLETLYEHMLRTMTPIYRQQASQLFQIVMASVKVQDQQPLTALQLSYAEEPDVCGAMATQVGRLTLAVEQARCEATEARLRSRCCGLVEVQEKPRKRPDGSGYTLLHVTFLHKTVVEYLSMESHWSTMLVLNGDLAFDPHYALMSSCLSFAKTASHDNSAFSMGGEGLSDLSRSFIIYTTIVEEVLGEPQTAVVDDFQQIITRNTPSETSRASRIWHLNRVQSPIDQVSSISQSMQFLALRFGLFRYVIEKLDDKPQLARGIHGTVLLREALYQFIFCGPITGDMSGLTYGRGCHFSKPSRRQYAYGYWQGCIRRLLARGADVNTQLPVLENSPENGEDLYSPWEMILELCVDLILNMHKKFLKAFDESDGWNSCFISIIKLLVEYGAEPNVIWVSTQRSGSALTIMDWLLRPSWFIQHGHSPISDPGQLRSEKARSELTSLLRARGGMEQEWLGGKLIMRNILKHQLVPEANSQGTATTPSAGTQPAGSIGDSVAAAKVSPRSRVRSLLARLVR